MELNDMLLKSALLDAATETFAEILDGESPDIRFSKKYLSRRRRFLKNPLGYVKPRPRTWQRYAVRAAVLVTVIFSLMMSARFTLTASASELSLMTKIYKDHLTYAYTQEYTPVVDVGDWHADYLPEGYREYKSEDAGDFCSIHYINGAKLIDFIYFHTSAYMNISMKGGYYDISPCEVNGEAAIFHRADKIGSSNVLMWFSDDGELVFMLDAPLPLEEMIKIAESVKLR